MISYFLVALDLRSRANEELGLIRGIAQKDPLALSRLYDLYAKLVYSLLLSVVRKQDEAEDILQEIFLQVWEKAPQFDESKGNVYSWLIALTRDRAIDHVRSKGYKNRQKELPHDHFDFMSIPPSENPLNVVVALEQSVLLKNALSMIPSEQRKVIEAAYFNGMSHMEIAREFRIPLGTVKTRIRQGMGKLYRELKEKL